MKKNKDNAAFTYIDLFAGLGGFHLAMQKLGGKCVFASELQEDLRQIYTRNYGIECAGDITKVDYEKDIPPHDVLCGGFPCQPFSKAGKLGSLSLLAYFSSGIKKLGLTFFLT